MTDPATQLFDLFAPGTMLGRYELLATIGEGGMARVILARQHGPAGFEKVVVVKVIHPRMAEDHAAIDMLVDEARVAAQINHPHVVQTFELGEAHGTYYVVMEYLAGESLQRILKTAALGPSLDPRMAARIVADAADGLHAAHELCDLSGRNLGLVHRDVSLGNLVVLYSGCVKVVDFGIAKSQGRITSATQEGQLKGKYGYMSPEQIRNEPLDRRSDVFALGVVLWECLALRRLFNGPSVPATLVQILEGERVPPSRHRPEVPPELDEIALRALAPDPRHRFDSAIEMRRALDDAIWQSRCDATDIQMYMTAVFGDRIRKRQALLARCVAQRPALDDDDLGFEQTSGIRPPAALRTEPLTATPPAGARPSVPDPVDPTGEPPELARAPARPTPEPPLLAGWQPAPFPAQAWIEASGQLLVPPRPAPPPAPAPRPRARRGIGILVAVAGVVVAVGLATRALVDDDAPAPAAAAGSDDAPAREPIATARTVKKPPPPARPERGDDLDDDDGVDGDERSVRTRLRPEHLEPMRVEPAAARPSAQTTRTTRTTRGPSARELYARATELYLDGDLAEAEATYRRALAGGRRFAPAHRGLGILYQRMGFTAKALDELKRYLALAPNAPDAPAIRERIADLGGRP